MSNEQVLKEALNTVFNIIMAVKGNQKMVALGEDMKRSLREGHKY